MGLRSFLNRLLGNEPKDTPVKENIQDGLRKAADAAEQTGKYVLDKAQPVLDKLEETSEKIGKEVLEQGKEWTGKAAGFTEDIGKKVLDATDSAWKTLQENAEDLGRQIFSKDDPAQSTGREEGAGDNTPPRASAFQPKEDPFKKYENSHEESSHLEALQRTPGMSGGSFFDKADQFARGNYDAAKEGPQILNDTPAEPPREQQHGPIAGFEDLDGDGDPLIDDAIVDPDTDPEKDA